MLAHLPLRSFQLRHPQGKVIPLTFRIDDRHDRLPTMGAVADRLHPGSGKRMKTVMNRDRLAQLVGFMSGSARLPGTLTLPTIRCARRRIGLPHRFGRQCVGRATDAR